METPLLQTKLHIPPPRPELVSRPRLIQRLDAGLRSSSKLTLISAPAGFGKTTLASEWVSHFGLGIGDFGSPARDASPIQNPRSEIQNRVAWLSLDEGDNDLTRFLAYLIAALQTVEAGLGKGVLSTLYAAQPQPPLIEAILTPLLNEIVVLPRRVALVLDDYHLIDAPPIHDALSFLLRHLPPSLHVAIATRQDPPLPLARLRAQGQLTELRAGDLRFTSSEAAQFLNQAMGLDLSAENVAALEERTEGWIAGLQLAAVSMQGRRDVNDFVQSFAGSHRFVLDYLVEEALEQQAQSVHLFLLQTAILDRLTGALCDAVRTSDTATGAEQRDGQSILRMLERANLFIVALDEERRWYRYHHLFGDLLRQRLRQTHPDWEPTLHLRASEWYEQNGFADDAIEHALSANKPKRAAHLIGEHADTLWVLGEHNRLQRWLVRLPEKSLYSEPQLCIYHAWFLFSIGQEEAAQRILEAVDQSLGPSARHAADTDITEPTSPPASAEKKLQGRLGAMRATMEIWWKDFSAVIEHAGQALEYLPTDDPWRGMAAVALGDVHAYRGDMAAAYQARLEFAASCKVADDIFLYMIAHLKVATSLRELGQLQQTIEICRQQVELARENGLSQTIFTGWAKGIWGISLAEQDKLDRALELATESVELTKGGDLSFSGFGRIVLAQVLFYTGDLGAAKSVLAEMEAIAQERYLPVHITDAMVAWQLRIWLAQNQPDLASQWARERGLDADKDLASPPTHVDMVLARVLLAQEKWDNAVYRLDRLLEAAERGGHTSRLIEVLVLQALALQGQNHTTQAMNALERALILAEPGGYVRVFTDAGPALARLLYDALSSSTFANQVQRLLAAFPAVEPKQTALEEGQASNASLIEPLSEREVQVLELIAEGLTNPEIASRLYLSLNTVKVHARNIYGKLGVNNRTQAAARARALGLLSPT